MLNTKQNETSATLGNKSDTWHTHDDRYYTRSEIDNKKYLSGGDYLRWLPGDYIDNPNGYFGMSSWWITAYFSLVNFTDSTKWSTIIGVYDNNNGDPQGRQLAIGTLGIKERRFTNGSWSGWSSI